MTDRENFLERWSRRKIEAERQTTDDAREQVPARTPETNDGNKAPASAANAPTETARHDRASTSSDTEPAFDITKLPSLESITAATDVRAFLAPGVPAELARAALRRAWIADPAIRDFKGLAENDWDFTDPNAMAGFTDLPADFDAKKVIAEIFGEKDKPADPATAAAPDHAVAPVQPSEQPRKTGSADETQPVAPEGAATAELAAPVPPASPEVCLVQRNDNTAMHNGNSLDGQEEAKTRRTHGKALPQ